MVSACVLSNTSVFSIDLFLSVRRLSPALEDINSRLQHLHIEILEHNGKVEGIKCLE